MNYKREARLRYYEGVRSAMLNHIQTTEDGLRHLEGVDPAKIKKIVSNVHKEHEKLLKRIDREIEQLNG